MMSSEYGEKIKRFLASRALGGQAGCYLIPGVQAKGKS